MLEATPDVTTEGMRYRPLSILAMLAFGIGVLSPLSLLSIHPALFAALALPGLVLSILACRRVAQAEGTLAGGRLALIGFGLSFATVLAWLTMYVTTAWIMQRESADFVDKWIEKVRQGKEGEAFLDTMSPKTRRITFPASDLKKLRARFPAKAGYNEFDLFRNGQLNALLLRYTDQLQWTRLGSAEFDYDKESYSVLHRYFVASGDRRVATYVDLVTTSEKVDTPRGPRRDWKVTVKGNFDPTQATTYMFRLAEAESEAQRALDYWLKDIAADRRAESLQALTTPDDPLRQTEFNHLYDALRKDVPAKATAVVQRSDQPFTLIKDVYEHPNGWRLTYRGDLQRNWEFDVECQITLETKNLEQGRAGWRISECKFLSDHRKTGRMMMSGIGGSMAPQ